MSGATVLRERERSLSCCTIDVSRKQVGSILRVCSQPHEDPESL